jgi:predicted CXXCH cytochrome family protein
MSGRVWFSGVVAVLALAVSSARGAGADDKCFACHDALGDKASVRFKRDIHRQKGISCAGCHGGDHRAEEMDTAMDSAKGFIGVPKGDAISAACTQCHGDANRMKALGASIPTNQMQMLQSSVHGKLSTTGKERIAQCTTCHGAHGILAVQNPASPVHPLKVTVTCAQCHNNAGYMRAYNPSLPVDQLEKYRTSVHGTLNAKGDAKVAQCASCHGSHDVLPANDVKSKVYPVNLPATCSGCHSNAEYMKQYKIPTTQYEEYAKSVHGIALLQKHDLGAPACNRCHGNHGAVPPGVESISKVCGTCHALNAELFSSSPHKRAFDERGLPECETCHGNHEIIAATNELLGVTSDAVCSNCHSEEDNAKGYRVAMTMRMLTDSLETMENRSRALVHDAEQKGMEIAEAKFKLRDVRQARLEARTTVHAFNEDKFREVVAGGFATAGVVTQEAQHAVDEYYFRRIGLGISTLIITVLAISLYLFIRRMEQSQK